MSVKTNPFSVPWKVFFVFKFKPTTAHVKQPTTTLGLPPDSRMFLWKIMGCVIHVYIPTKLNNLTDSNSSGFHSKIFHCKKMIESVKCSFFLVLFFHFNIHRCYRFAVYGCRVCWFVQMKLVVPHCLVRKSHDHEQDWKHSALLRTEVFSFRPTVCQFSQPCPMIKKTKQKQNILGWFSEFVYVCVHFYTFVVNNLLLNFSRHLKTSSDTYWSTLLYYLEKSHKQSHTYNSNRLGNFRQLYWKNEPHDTALSVHFEWH